MTSLSVGNNPNPYNPADMIKLAGGDMNSIGGQEAFDKSLQEVQQKGSNNLLGKGGGLGDISSMFADSMNPLSFAGGPQGMGIMLLAKLALPMLEKVPVIGGIAKGIGGAIGGIGKAVGGIFKGL